jgi:hypothetical protein
VEGNGGWCYCFLEMSEPVGAGDLEPKVPIPIPAESCHLPGELS